MCRRIFHSLFIFIFSSVSLNVRPVHGAQLIIPPMPKPGVMVKLSPAFEPARLVGLTVHPDNALKFDFLVNKGDEVLTAAQESLEYKNLVKYFMASLTIPNKDQWVNLSPYEKNRIIEGDLGKTEMGRELLAQDYFLKQITSSLMYPESGLGRDFWDKVYAQAAKELGPVQIPVNTFNKVWIMPDEAVVYESGDTAYVIKTHLKVMLAEDYLSLTKHVKPSAEKTHTVVSKIIKSVILPALEKEVNEGKNFAKLRQIVSGMVLSTWYKKALKGSLLGKIYADRAKTKFLSSPQASIGDPEKIYLQYLKALKKGVYNYIKEDEDRYTHQPMARKYFAGGLKGVSDAAMRVVDPQSARPGDIDRRAILGFLGGGLVSVAVGIQTADAQTLKPREPNQFTFTTKHFPNGYFTEEITAMNGDSLFELIKQFDSWDTRIPKEMKAIVLDDADYRKIADHIIRFRLLGIDSDQLPGGKQLDLYVVENLLEAFRLIKTNKTVSKITIDQNVEVYFLDSTNQGKDLNEILATTYGNIIVVNLGNFVRNVGVIRKIIDSERQASEIMRFYTRFYGRYSEQEAFIVYLRELLEHEKAHTKTIEPINHASNSVKLAVRPPASLAKLLAIHETSGLLAQLAGSEVPGLLLAQFLEFPDRTGQTAIGRAKAIAADLIQSLLLPRLRTSTPATIEEFMNFYLLTDPETIREAARQLHKKWFGVDLPKYEERTPIPPEVYAYAQEHLSAKKLTDKAMTKEEVIELGMDYAPNFVDHFQTIPESAVVRHLALQKSKTDFYLELLYIAQDEPDLYLMLKHLLAVSEDKPLNADHIMQLEASFSSVLRAMDINFFRVRNPTTLRYYLLRMLYLYLFFDFLNEHKPSDLTNQLIRQYYTVFKLPFQQDLSPADNVIQDIPQQLEALTRFAVDHIKSMGPLSHPKAEALEWAAFIGQQNFIFDYTQGIWIAIQKRLGIGPRTPITDLMRKNIRRIITENGGEATDDLVKAVGENLSLQATDARVRKASVSLRMRFQPSSANVLAEKSRQGTIKTMNGYRQSIIQLSDAAMLGRRTVMASAAAAAAALVRPASAEPTLVPQPALDPFRPRFGMVNWDKLPKEQLTYSPIPGARPLNHREALQLAGWIAYGPNLERLSSHGVALDGAGANISYHSQPVLSFNNDGTFTERLYSKAELKKFFQESGYQGKALEDLVNVFVRGMVVTYDEPLSADSFVYRDLGSSTMIISDQNGNIIERRTVPPAVESRFDRLAQGIGRAYLETSGDIRWIRNFLKEHRTQILKILTTNHTGDNLLKAEDAPRTYYLRSGQSTLKVRFSKEGRIEEIQDLAMNGGISLNADNMKLIDVKRDGRGVPLPVNQQDLAQLSRVAGLDIKILYIRPVVPANLPIVSELQKQNKLKAIV